MKSKLTSVIHRNYYCYYANYKEELRVFKRLYT